MSKRVIKNRNNFSLEIDLVETFGRELSEADVIAFGQAVIDTILDRTQSNQGSDGDRFDNYSESYAESLEFLAAGKSRTDPNLELTGQMLLDLDIIEASPSMVKIGFRNTLQRDKGYNHHVGDTVPARPFMDLTDKEFSSLKEEFAPQEEEETGGLFETASETSTIRSLLDILGDSDIFGGGNGQS